ncbi:hypothetical protein Acy02nite_05270 [Actinoplanes cyaneus]|uniref:Carboxypeptidase regulatory-like domain-containing protein n=1 Tax=Actinoplanes cyaneus TaxID=52696 RepID=A0A919M947_9ACTN|nr:hypothetical protein [Actinoplanes cyaneus]MCW2135988.1 hypothetical protein [Actinoplanes cyaneus]GID62646.1 hypothetical protein Acy02nite_05270 [Actinoplanes cyaneus]
MSDISKLLAAEAQRLQPARAPEFAELLAARDRRRRSGTAAGVVVLIAAVTGGTALMVDNLGPRGQQGPARQPAVAVPTASVPVSGTLHQVGGPVGAGPRSIAGTVHFQSAEGVVVTSVDVGADGRFSLTVPVGTYRVTATPAGNPTGLCQAEGDVIVPAAGLADVEVNCHVR